MQVQSHGESILESLGYSRRIQKNKLQFIHGGTLAWNHIVIQFSNSPNTIVIDYSFIHRGMSYEPDSIQAQNVVKQSVRDRLNSDLQTLTLEMSKLNDQLSQQLGTTFQPEPDDIELPSMAELLEPESNIQSTENVDVLMSPDGHWMWSGSEWVPAPPSSPPETGSISIQDSIIIGDISQSKDGVVANQQDEVEKLRTVLFDAVRNCETCDGTGICWRCDGRGVEYLTGTIEKLKHGGKERIRCRSCNDGEHKKGECSVCNGKGKKNYSSYKPIDLDYIKPTENIQQFKLNPSITARIIDFSNYYVQNNPSIAKFVHINPNIPEKKLNYAIKKSAPHAEENICCIIHCSGFGPMKKYILITDSAIYFKNSIFQDRTGLMKSNYPMNGRLKLSNIGKMSAEISNLDTTTAVLDYQHVLSLPTEREVFICYLKSVGYLSE